MNNTPNKWLITVSMAIALTACGGGGGSDDSKDISPPPLTISMSGKVIDGYVSGATVWLDINGNSIFDAGSEPSVISGAAGEYAFEFTESQASCVPYSTIYVDVPVGAIDEDSGEVTEAYQMALPPSVTPLTDDDIRHISPLTSVLWEQISAKLNSGIEPVLSCENLKNNFQLRSDLQQEISSVMWNLVSHYNISEEQIFADFIADNNTHAYDIAQAIVTGLKASFAYREELKAQNPNAHEIRVVIYQDKLKDETYQFDDAWYRKTVIFSTDRYTHKDVKLKQDLTEVDVVLTDLVAIDKPWGDQALKGMLRVRKDAYYNTDGTYRCAGYEAVSFDQNGVKYHLSNWPEYTYSDNLSECATSFDTPSSRAHRVSFVENGKYYSAEFIFQEEQAEFNSLPDWFNLEDKASQLSPSELIAHQALLPKGWNEPVLFDVRLWRKRMEDGAIQIDKDSDGKWIKATLRSDYTRVYECSTDGVNWTSCNPY
jgi:hypothetical protein